MSLCECKQEWFSQKEGRNLHFILRPPASKILRMRFGRKLCRKRGGDGRGGTIQKSDFLLFWIRRVTRLRTINFFFFCWWSLVPATIGLLSEFFESSLEIILPLNFGFPKGQKTRKKKITGHTSKRINEKALRIYFTYYSLLNKWLPKFRGFWAF